MNETLKRFVQAYGAGALGGFVACMLFTLLFKAGVMEILNVTEYQPRDLVTFRGVVGDRYWPWLYESLVLYGVMGFIFLIPVGTKMPQMNRALIISLFPAALTLLYTLPHNGREIFGLKCGGFTFVFVLLYSAAWGLITSTLAPSPE